MRTTYRCTVLFVGLIAAYVLSLTLISCLSNARIDYHVDLGCQQLWQEGSKPTGYGGEAGAQLDNATDVLMLERAVRDQEQGALYAAMDQRDYARYWHGYLLVLRPLLKLFSYADIRVLHYFALLLLAFACVTRATQRLGAVAGAGLALSLLMGFISVVPLSMQYVSVFYIAFAALLLVLDTRALPQRLSLCPFFLLVGSLTNFFDFLTVPLLTLGYPLLAWLLLDARPLPNAPKDVHAHVKLLRTLALGCVCWALGYGLTWAAKWLVGGVILGRDVIGEALASILHRTVAAGTQIEYPLDYVQMFTLNLRNFLPRGARVALVITFLACAVRVLRRGIDPRRFVLCLLLALPALFPYVWYAVLGNHSQVHAWFTYRLQMMSVFSVFCALSALEKQERARL